MLFLQQSVIASVVLGPVLDPDGVEVDDMVIGDFSAAKNGGELTVLAAPEAVTSLGNGHYRLTATAELTNTLGRLEIVSNREGVQCPTKELTIVADPFDLCDVLGAEYALPLYVGENQFAVQCSRHLRQIQRTSPTVFLATRGGQSCEFVATVGRSTAEGVGPDGVLTEYDLADILIAAADYTLSPAKPKRGDVLTATGSGNVYRVAHPQPMTPVCSPFGIREPVIGWRVHTVPEEL